MGLFNLFSSGDERSVVCSCERCQCTCGGCHCCQCVEQQRVSRPPSFFSGLFSFWTSTAPDEEAMGQEYAPPVYIDYAPTYQRPQPRYQQMGCSLPAPEPEYQPGQEMVPYSGPKFDAPGGFGFEAPGFGWEVPSFQFPEMPMPEFPFGE